MENDTKSWELAAIGSWFTAGITAPQFPMPLVGTSSCCALLFPCGGTGETHLTAKPALIRTAKGSMGSMWILPSLRRLTFLRLGLFRWMIPAAAVRSQPYFRSIAVQTSVVAVLLMRFE